MVTCGFCGEVLPDRIENCRMETGGGVGLTVRGEDAVVGLGGSGVRIVASGRGVVIHDCGNAMSA